MFCLVKNFLTELNRFYFNRTCRKLRQTKAINYKYRDDIRILTLLCHDDVDMYLLAIKSFLFNFTIGSVHVLEDGSLTAADVKLLKFHIPMVKIHHVNDVDATGFPSCNIWKRLLYSIDLSQDAYVIQLDSDTVSMKPMLDLQKIIKEERGFIIGNGPAWGKPVEVGYLSRLIKSWVSGNVIDDTKLAAESEVHTLAFFQNAKYYLRGCSGFSGLPRGQINRELLLDFSQQITAAIGEPVWSSSGSEQIACSVMISRTRNPVILPWLMYQNFGLPSFYKESLVTAALVHFVRKNRFKCFAYQKMCADFIRDYNLDKPVYIIKNKA